jgi:PPP family 3-phenylpropionic acid transporter
VRIKGPIAYIILYVALYAAFGAASPFWPKFFETRGLTSQQIGLILGAAILVRLAAGPLVGTLVDFLGSLRLMFATSWQPERPPRCCWQIPSGYSSL